MTKNQFYSITYTLLLTSTILAISSTNWLFIWIAIELNLLCFIPIMSSSNNFQETEASVKYFLNQALGSSLLLMSSILINFHNMFNITAQIILTVRLALKIGAAPFHLWYPSVISAISWINCLILSTWQKLAPLAYVAIIISSAMYNIIIIIASIRAFLGGMLGINQSKLRSIIAYSSITHIGWICGLILVKPFITILYFLIYSIIIMPLFLIFHFKNMSYISQINKSINTSPLLQALIPLLLLSLSGIPPLTGFVPKWITILYLTPTNSTLLIILILGSLIRTYYYLSIIFSAIINFNSLRKAMYINENSIKPLQQVFIIISLSSLILIPYLIILYALNIFYKP